MKQREESQKMRSERFPWPDYVWLQVIIYIVGFVLSGSGSHRRVLTREEHDLASILTGYL